MESWRLFSEKVVNTAQHIIQEIVSTLPNAKQDTVLSNEPKIDMPTDPTTSKDLLKKVYFLRSQLNILCSCLIELYAAPFPYPKNIRPCKVFRLISVLPQIRMSSVATGLGHENKVVLAVLPDVYVSVIQVLLECLRCFSEDLVLFVPEFLKLVLQGFGDIRQIGGIRQYGQKAFTLMKISLYKLVIVLCDTFGAGLGLENYATELIPFIISDFIPSNETITLTVTGATKNQTGKKQKKKSSSQYFGGQIPTHVKVANDSNSSLVSTSLAALSAVFVACGAFISQSCHKNVQCCILALCLELQRCNVGGRPIPFDDPECRRCLYQSLFDLVFNTHPRWPAPFRYAFHIFHLGYLNDHHPNIRMVCGKGTYNSKYINGIISVLGRIFLATSPIPYEPCILLPLLLIGLTLCESVSQPRSSTLNLELPMSPEEIEKIKEEMMKVHTIVLTTHSSRPYDNGMPLHFASVSNAKSNVNSNGGMIELHDPERMKFPEEVNKENSTSIQEDFNKHDKEERLKDPAYKLLSGRENLKLAENSSSKCDTKDSKNRLKNQGSEDEDAYVIPDTAEREEIMKSFYDFGKEPIFIPDEVKNRGYNKVAEDNPAPSKKQKMADASETYDTKGPSTEAEDNIDLETMLGAFVNKFIDE